MKGIIFSFRIPSSPGFEVSKNRARALRFCMDDPRVFETMETLKRSGRGELRITDVNNEYIRAGQRTCAALDVRWAHAGAFRSQFTVGTLVANQHRENDR